MQHELPVGTRGGDRADEVEIEPLVDDAEEPKPRGGIAGLVGGILGRVAGARKMRDVDTARECVHVRVHVALGFVERLARR